MRQNSEGSGVQDLWLGKSAPRYTSYPAAPYFKPDFPAEQYLQRLKNIVAGEPISLYLHIPFCEKLCWFCGCNTSIAHHYDQVAKYLPYLYKEINMVAEIIGKNNPVGHIHFGGGSPTILTPQDFDALNELIRSKFNIAQDAKIAIEIDPRTLTPEKIASYVASGINRASLGVQDFDLNVQNAINRVQPYELVARSCDDLRNAGIEAINIDLIYGLPMQTEATFSETLQKAIGLSPSRMALFSYAHVPWAKKQQLVIEEPVLPSDQEKLAIYSTADAMLKNSGYSAIGIDHYAKDDDALTIAVKNKTLKRNFQGYTDDYIDSLIGLGISSIGKLPDLYIQNRVNSKEYFEALDNDILPTGKGIVISEEDVMRKEIIDSLMCYMEVDLQIIADKYARGDDYFAPELESLRPYIEGGIIAIDGQKIRLTSEYRMAVRSICAVFDQYSPDGQARYSKVS